MVNTYDKVTNTPDAIRQAADTAGQLVARFDSAVFIGGTPIDNYLISDSEKKQLRELVSIYNNAPSPLSATAKIALVVDYLKQNSNPAGAYMEARYTELGPEHRDYDASQISRAELAGRGAVARLFDIPATMPNAPLSPIKDEMPAKELRLPADKTVLPHEDHHRKAHPLTAAEKKHLAVERAMDEADKKNPAMTAAIAELKKPLPMTVKVIKGGGKSHQKNATPHARPANFLTQPQNHKLAQPGRHVVEAVRREVAQFAKDFMQKVETSLANSLGANTISVSTGASVTDNQPQTAHGRVDGVKSKPVGNTI